MILHAEVVVVVVVLLSLSLVHLLSLLSLSWLLKQDNCRCWNCCSCVSLKEALLYLFAVLMVHQQGRQEQHWDGGIP